jgi:cysteine desulfurase
MRIGNTIYLDHQATTPLDRRVLGVMTLYVEGNFANPHSADHALGWQAAQVADESAAKIAALIGADADEIVFTSGATESNNLAVLGLGRREAGGKRRRILVSAIEHKCVLAATRALGAQCGYRIELLPVDCVGRVDSAALEETLDEDVLLVSVAAVNNEIGTIQDIRNIAAAVHKYGAYFHCDAAQAPCAIDLEDASSFCDFLSLSAHKMYGPKGIGALFIRRALQGQIEPLIYGGGQQRGLRPGTVPVPLCVGMSAAAELLSGDAAREERELIRSRRDKFACALKKLRFPVELNGPKGALRHPGNVSVRFFGFSAHDILGAIQPRIAASTGSACSSGIPEPSHVLRAIGLSAEEAESSVRFSIGRGTTNADVDEAVDMIDGTLSRLAADGRLAETA